MRSVVILELEFPPRTVVLVHQVLHAHDHARDADFLSAQRLEVLQLRKPRLAHVVDDDLVFVERMGRKVQTHHLALLGQLLQLAPVGARRKHRTLDVHVPAAPEKALLGIVPFGLEPLPVTHQLLDEGLAARIPQVDAEEFAAREVRNGVEGPGIGEVLDALAVDQREVHTLDEVEDVLEGPVGRALGDDALHGGGPDALHGGHAETDVARTVGREGPHRLVDVGPQHADAHALALVHVERQLLDVREVAAQHRGHVFRRVVGLEVGRLERHPRIARRMRLVEGVGGELLPVAPDLLEHPGVVAVLRASLDEFRLQVVQLVLELLAHRLAQRVRLAAREVRKQAREQHDLLLVDRDAVGVLEVLLHHRDVVDDRTPAVLARDEVRDVVHRARTVEGVHGDQILEGRGLQLPEVLLHPRGLELERPDGASLAVKPVGRKIVDDREVVDIDLRAPGLADVLHGVLDDRQGLQTQEVHLDEPRVLDHRAFVLRDEHLLARHLVVGRRNRHPVGDVVAADDRAAGVHARIADVALEHLGVEDRIVQDRVVGLLGGLQLRNQFDGLREVLHRLAVGRLVGNELAQSVRFGEQQLLHARNVLDGQLRGHRAVGNDVRDLLLAVFLRHPVQHAPAAVVVEVHVDIGQRDAVGVQEALEQQVVGDGVDLRDAQAVGYGRTGRGASARAYRDVELLAGRADEVLHDEEVAREAHRLHHVQLEAQALLLLLGQVLAVAAAGALHRELRKVVGLELDTVEFVIAPEFLDLLAPLLLGHHHAAVLVARELVVEILLREALAVARLGSELRGNLELRHDRRVVDRVVLDPVADLDRRGHRLGIRLPEDRGHLGGGLEPLLLRIEHALRVVEILSRREADQAVVRLGVVLVDEVHVVRADRADMVFRGQLPQVFVDLQLHGVGLVVRTLDGGLVELQLEEVVLAEEVLVPQHRLLGPGVVLGRNGARHLPGQAGRAADQPLVVFFQLRAIRSRAHVESFGPRLRDDLDEVVVSLEVLGQQDQVVTALVGLALLVVQAPARDVDLAADDRLEGEFPAQLRELLLAAGDLRRGVVGRLPALVQCREALLARRSLLLELALDLLDVVVELLDPEHVAVIRHGDAGLSVVHGLVDQALDAGLAVEDGILRVYVQMDEPGHESGKFLAQQRYANNADFYGSALAFFQQNA